MNWKNPLVRIKNMAAVSNSFDYFQAHAIQGHRTVAPVLKSDAYGMGIDNVAPVLYHRGARLFFTSDVNEALEIKSALKADDIDIYTLHGFDSDTWPEMMNERIYPVLNTEKELSSYSAVLSENDLAGRKAAIQFNTGMNRSCFSLHDYITVLNAGSFDKLNIAFHMTHLCAVDLNASSNQENSMKQLENLQGFLNAGPKRPLSVTATHGSLYIEHLGKMPVKQDIERIGVGIFGDIPGHDFAFSASAKILSVNHVGAGEKIGYDLAYTLKQDSKIAVVDIGYGDGYPREASVKDDHEGKKAYMTIGGVQAPVVGLVAMNMTCIDVTDVPESILLQNNYAEIIGKNTPIHHLAECAKTNIEDIMISLNRRSTRAADYILQ